MIYFFFHLFIFLEGDIYYLYQFARFGVFTLPIRVQDLNSADAFDLSVVLDVRGQGTFKQGVDVCPLVSLDKALENLVRQTLVHVIGRMAIGGSVTKEDFQVFCYVLVYDLITLWRYRTIQYNTIYDRYSALMYIPLSQTSVA